MYTFNSRYRKRLNGILGEAKIAGLLLDRLKDVSTKELGKTRKQPYRPMTIEISIAN